jgi:hypothetical protein
VAAVPTRAAAVLVFGTADVDVYNWILFLIHLSAMSFHGLIIIIINELLITFSIVFQ